mgnify:CR=1 FL=1
MVPQRSGKIINICSVFSFLGGRMSSAYAATKHGIAGLTKAYCDELVTSGAVVANANGRNDAAALRTAVAAIVLESVRLNLALRNYGAARDGERLAIERYGETAQLRAYEGEALLGTAQAPAELPLQLRARGLNKRDQKEADARELARLFDVVEAIVLR